jgi:acyl-CoA dehydrogenase
MSAQSDSVYFTPEHHAFRVAVRRFVQTEMTPYVDQWEAAGGFPRELYQKCGALGLLGLGHEEAYGGTPGTDIFHLLILGEEMVTAARCGGLAATLMTTYIATPPIRVMGTPEQKQRFLPKVIRGEWVAALGITEPDAGSDVAGIRTRAVREGDVYVVNGAKTFITCGTEADLVTTAVRTGGEGSRGLSLLVIPTDTPGFAVTRKLDKMGWRCSDTAELAFQDCRVPASNLIGRENEGFKAIMTNFQTERLMLATMAVASAELALSEALVYAQTRRAFGAPLSHKQVIQHKLAEMATEVDVAREYVRRIAYRTRHGDDCTMEVSMAKNVAYRTAARVIDDAVQIHGGLGFMTGTVVERLYRDNRVLGIGGGANEIMNEIIAKRLLQ